MHDLLVHFQKVINFIRDYGSRKLRKFKFREVIKHVCRQGSGVEKVVMAY